MLVLSGDQSRSVADLLLGNVDIAFIRTGMAESLHGREIEGAGGATVVSDIDRIKILEPKNPTVVATRPEGERYGTPR